MHAASTLKPKAVIIIPTYNERENIQKVVPIVLKVASTVSNWNIEILVVDDSSPDNTAEAVRLLAKKYSSVHLLLNKTKSGLGGAYLKGMAEAFGKYKADIIFEFDADLSHDPKRIPAFLEKIDQGYDMVLGSRYIKGGSIPENWGWHRKFLSVVGNLTIMIILTNFSIRDWTGGYRAISKAVYQKVHTELQSELFSGYTFQIGFLHKAVRAGFKITEVPFNFNDRTIGESKLGPEYLKNTLLYILKARFDEIVTNRIFKFAIVGGIGASIQLITLALFRQLFFYDLAFFLAIECAVLSNFLLNNIWTFSDRKLSLVEFPLKFIQFNLASAGSIVIQQIVGSGGRALIGLFVVFTLPILNIDIDTGAIYAVLGILIGMFWNFFAYSFFIWKKK